MLNLLKKQGIAAYLALVATILGLVAVIIYSVNIGSVASYWYQTDNGTIIALSVVGILLYPIAIVVANLGVKFGEGNKVIKLAADILASCLLVLATVFLLISAMLFLEDRVEGLAYIYGSDADVAGEVQTPDNLHYGSQAITGIVFYLIAWLAGTVSCFVSLTKKEKKED